MTGPSTNIYVGPHEIHYTIPKRLLYHFSDFAKACLEGSFLEARANAVWLPDVDPNIFRWLLQSLYTGNFKVTPDFDRRESERSQVVCQTLCRVHILGERLLFDRDFLRRGIHEELDTLIEKATTSGELIPLTPEIVEEVLTNSAPTRYWGNKGPPNFANPSMRRFILRHLCTFQFCTTVDFMDFADCFERDGAFAAEMMVFMASELKWAKERWEAQVGLSVDVVEKKMQCAKEEGNAQCVTMRSKTGQGVWLALRCICTFAGCQTTDFRAYSQCFELDGEFAAAILAYQAEEVLWIVEMWGKERGSSVDVAAEREEEYEIEKEKSDLERMVHKFRRRRGWT